MYEEYFGLKRSPFRITPDTSLFYDGGHRGDILGALVYAVHRGEGIIKVVGEVGSGKTMLCRMLQLELPESIEIIYIANPSVSAEDILYVIASELKFDIARDASKHEVVSMLHHYLLEKHAEDKQVVLFVEEAQGMPLETLEEIRLLSNLETDQHKLLQMILFGQPELDDNLAKNSIRQLRERITHDFNLSPLTGADIHKYLNFRMREVGYTGPELISPKLAGNMAKHSEGLLRRINILADKMLLSAFAGGTHTLTNKHLLAAVKDSGFSKLGSSEPTRYGWFWLMSGVLILLFAAITAMQMGYFTKFKEVWAATTIFQPVVIVEKALNQSVNENKVDQTVAALTRDELEASAPSEVTAEIPREIAEDKRVPKAIEPVAEVVKLPVKQKMLTESKKNQQTTAKLGIVHETQIQQNQTLEVDSSSEKYEDYQQWLDAKIKSSKQWLRNADKQSVSIQVMMRSKSAGRDLVEFLKTEWPLELDKTYLYEVKMQNKEIYRVFYDEYPSITLGQIKMKQLPESVRVNSPYLHS
ncbi:MAG: AAA family ATPase, partial [Gammaproteobacteria bacterium]|nr:AAA family ATPase [Gammaproteobacteria bacterium]